MNCIRAVLVVVAATGLRRRQIAPFALGLCGLLLAVASHTVAYADPLEGSWVIASIYHNGKDVTGETTSCAQYKHFKRFDVYGGRVALRFSFSSEMTPGDKYFCGFTSLLVTIQYKANDATKPPSIDFELPKYSGSNPGKDIRLAGIYELNGDELKVCISQPGKERPTSFRTKEGADWQLLNLMRKKNPTIGGKTVFFGKTFYQ